MSWIMTLLVLSFALSSYPSEARSTTEKKRHPLAVVVGTVYCDTCFQNKFSHASHFISGASVAVECDATNSKPSFYKEVKTNKHGDFKVKLPFSVGKHVKNIQGCSVKLIRSSHPYCAVATTTTSSSLRLKSRSPRTQIFTAGAFTFKPLTQPKLCKQKSSVQLSKDLDSVKSSDTDPAFPEPFQDPETPEFPPEDDSDQFAVPMPKLPSLPPLPSLPGLPFLPPINPAPKDSSQGSDDNKISNQKTFVLPTNPFHPPIIVLSPFQPPPSISTPPPFSMVPPLIHAPPSPPPPAFSLIPPFPFQPSLGFPGTPPPAREKMISP